MGPQEQAPTARRGLHFPKRRNLYVTGTKIDSKSRKERRNKRYAAYLLKVHKTAGWRHVARTHPESQQWDPYLLSKQREERTADKLSRRLAPYDDEPGGVILLDGSYRGPGTELVPEYVWYPTREWRSVEAEAHRLACSPTAEVPYSWTFQERKKRHTSDILAARGHAVPSTPAEPDRPWKSVRQEEVKAERVETGEDDPFGGMDEFGF